jgi:hypothetical protein
MTTTPAPTPGRMSPLAVVLILTSALFIGILGFAYVETKKANPIFLDEHGKVKSSSTDQNAQHHQ